MTKPRRDVTGQRFGRLIATRIALAVPYKNTKWECICDCGATSVVALNNLTNGVTQSCGCLCRELSKGHPPTHGHSKQGTSGMQGSRTYISWQSMRRRCLTPTDPNFPRYGGRGISICEKWGSFASFLADMGERPPRTSLDRIDNAKGYEPSNCRWATPAEQSRNRGVSTLEHHEPDQIRWLSSLGYRRCDVAALIGVSRGVVSRVAIGEGWVTAAACANLVSI